MHRLSLIHGFFRSIFNRNQNRAETVDPVFQLPHFVLEFRLHGIFPRTVLYTGFGGYKHRPVVADQFVKIGKSTFWLG